MDPLQPTSQNEVFGDSFLGSRFLDPSYLFDQGSVFFRNIFNYSSDNSADISSTFNTILFFLGMFFLIIIFYTTIRMFEIRKKEHNYLHHEIEEYAQNAAERERKSQQKAALSDNVRWIKTLDYLFSESTSDWKLAVIEADSMLEALFDQLGFKGSTLGEKLKSATQDKFRSLTSAWEVHNIRNKIAHEGGSFDLSHREAKRVIAVYEGIFKEFGYI